MVDVFISYKRRLRPRVELLAERLRALRLDVWFDAGLKPGMSFGEDIAFNVRTAKAVVVCWSADAFPSGGDQNGWVRGEAMVGRERRALAAVQLEACVIDPPFNMDHVEDMATWNGEESAAFRNLVARIGDLCGRPGLGPFPGLGATAEAVLGWANAFPEDPLAAGPLAVERERVLAAERDALLQQYEAEKERQAALNREFEARLSRLAATTQSSEPLPAAAALLKQPSVGVKRDDDKRLEPAQGETGSQTKKKPSSLRWSLSLSFAAFALVAVALPGVRQALQDMQSRLPGQADVAVTPEAARKEKDAQEAFDLGIKYAEGKGVTQDYAKAREWYEKAAAGGIALAMTNIGSLYHYGKGVTRDYAKAREWYEKAAAGGDALAMRNIGVLYQNGHGVTQDYAKAREWYDKAAAGGDTGAMNNIGWLYYNGQGVTRDYAKAREWYEKAAAGGDTGAMTNIGSLYHYGQGVTQDYAKAREWYEKAAAGGDAATMTSIGFVYEYGVGVPKNPGKAAEWYQKALDGGDADAKAALARVKGVR